MNTPKAITEISPDFQAMIDAMPVRSEEECDAWERAEAEKALAKKLDAFLAELDDEYLITTDSRRTPHAELAALFRANAKAGDMEFPVNEAAFRDAMKAKGSLYLHGLTGSGKTRAALRRAFNGLRTGEWQGVRFVRFSAVTAKYSSGPAPELPFDPETKRLLIIDDFLNAKTIAARKEAFAGEMLSLLEARLMNNLPTILTANRDLRGACEWFDACGVDAPSVVRRLAQKTTVIPF